MQESDILRFYSAIGARIRAERKKVNLKQEALGAVLNLSRASIVNIEMGRQRPSIHLLWEVSKILNIQLQDLIPQFESNETLNPKWKKIIDTQLSNAQMNDKNTTEKILGFIGDVSNKK
ncbi:MAG: helix-turn-helix transcriptional regulator [Bacteroidetes bacterium]|nr:helix-turn-helix transcriptional regulator [Bacteroidota bacterium]